MVYDQILGLGFKDRHKRTTNRQIECQITAPGRIAEQNIIFWNFRVTVCVMNFSLETNKAYKNRKLIIIK